MGTDTAKKKPGNASLWFDFFEPVGTPIMGYLSILPVVVYFFADFDNAVGFWSTSLVLLKGLGVWWLVMGSIIASFWLVLNCLWFEPPDGVVVTEQNSNWVIALLWLVSMGIGLLVFTGIELTGAFVSGLWTVLWDCSPFRSEVPQHCETARQFIVGMFPKILLHIYMGAVLMIIASYVALIMVALTRLIIRHTDQRFWVRTIVSAACSVVLPIGITLILYNLFGVQETSSLAIAAVSVGATQYGASLFSFG